jgi:hypothetical protein
MDIKSARRKSFDVTYVIVSEENIEEVAAWCGGEIGGEGAERFVKVTDKNAISARQTKAFVGDYILKMSESGTSFKAFTEKAFNKSYEPIVASGEKAREVSRSAQSGQFVSHEEAEKHPDVTVTETVQTPIAGNAFTPSPTPQNEPPYWEVHDDETIYFDGNTKKQITKAEYDNWGK